MSSMKEIIETFQNRVKSPVVGSVVLSFMVINWKALFYLFFETDVSTKVRLEYFDQITSRTELIWLPLVFGCIFALILPVINFGAAWIIRKPVEWHRLMNEKIAGEIAYKKLEIERINNARLEEEFSQKQKLQALEEKRIIEKAKLEDELNEIKNPDVKRQAKEKLRELDMSNLDTQLLAELLLHADPHNVSANQCIQIAQAISDFNNGTFSEEASATRLRSAITAVQQSIDPDDFASFWNMIMPHIPEKIHPYRNKFSPFHGSSSKPS